MSLTLEESVRLLVDGLAEENRKVAEENRKLAETQKHIAESLSMELAETQKQLSARLDKTQKQLSERLAESYQKLADENRKFSEELREYKKENRLGIEDLRKNHKRVENTFNTQWGRLVEALVKNQVIPLLRERGIPVHRTSQRVHGMAPGNRNYEFDIIAENGDTIVVIEVKTTLRVDDVKDFLDELKHFKQWLPRFSNMKVHGAVAFLHDSSEAAIYAAKSGLFTILATGSSAAITNPQEFQPHEF